MKIPKISIIVPVYNTDKYLARCIDSILSQIFSDFELLLVDDGSTDNSGAICDEYTKKDIRVRVFHKENGGVSSARNIGIENAVGDWIAFVDSDDWLEETMFSYMYDTVQQENADIAYCDINMCFQDYCRVWKAPEYDTNKVIFLNNFIKSEWTSLCNLLINRNLFVANLIRNPEEYSYAEDYHVSVRLMYFADKIAYVRKPLYCYNRINESSAVHNFCDYEKERHLNLDVIDYFRGIGVYNDYAESLSWRLLKSAQEYVLDKDEHDKFLLLHPDGHKYIWSCPYINTKMKIMMWSLSHRLRFIALLLLFARRLRMKISKD